MMKKRIGIVGGGIGGLSLALGLLKQGRNVCLFEQSPQLGEVGAGLSVTPNAALGLVYLNMTEFMEKHSDRPQWQYTYHGKTDEELVAIDRREVTQQYGAPYYQIHRADFHDELVRRVNLLDPNCIRLDKRATNIQQDETGVKIQFASGEEEHVDALIGADGIRSLVRDEIFQDDEPAFTGYVAWRGLIPSEQLPSWYGEAASRVWVGPGRSCVCYPVRQGKLINFVAFAKTTEWSEEGWSIKAEPDEIARVFEGWNDKVTELVKNVPNETAFRWALFSREPVSTLIEQNVALIGDAAHPMLPFFGQGASSAIEDAVVLARCFDAAETTDDALLKYNKARYERVSFLQRESNLGGERLQGLDPYVLKNQPLKNEDALGIFKYNPVQVSV